MSLIDRTQAIRTSYNAGLYSQNTNYQPKFVQTAVSSPYTLSHPRAADTEGIKASPLAKNLDILA